MPELAGELEARLRHADPASLSRWLIRNGYRYKKNPSGQRMRSSRHRQARDEWTGERQPRMRLEPHRLVFLDETGTTTKMTRLRGRSLKGQRLRAKAPFGHWKTQTFIAGLRCAALTAPFVIDAPMDRRIFETYVETQLAPTLENGDIVIMDNLPAHKSTIAEKAIRERAHGFSSCRPTVPISIRSRWPSPSSRPICAPGPKGQSTPFGAPSAKSATSSNPTNAKTTSPPQDMDSIDRPML